MLLMLMLPSGSAEDYLIDGYITLITHHIDKVESNSYIELIGKDFSHLMNLEEKVKTWSDVYRDSDIARFIFSSYGLDPQVTGNSS